MQLSEVYRCLKKPGTRPGNVVSKRRDDSYVSTPHITKNKLRFGDTKQIGEGNVANLVSTL